MEDFSYTPMGDYTGAAPLIDLGGGETAPASDTSGFVPDELQQEYSAWVSAGNQGSFDDFKASLDNTGGDQKDNLVEAQTTAPQLVAKMDPEVFSAKPLLSLSDPADKTAQAAMPKFSFGEGATPAPLSDNPVPPAIIPGSGGTSAFAPLFEEKGAQYGVRPSYLDRTAGVESRHNPSAQNPNSSAGGLFQFIDSTAKGYGLTDKFDPAAATDAAARLARDNATTLRGALGREPSDGELYLAHQQGAGGAVKILTNPDAPLESLVGSQAARLNGGAGLTGGQFAQKYINKIEGPNASPMAYAPSQAVSPLSSYEGQMARVGAATLPSNGFLSVQPGALPATTNVKTRPLLSDLTAPEGQLETGNIDLTKRPVVKNDDGSISTVRSIGVNIDGKEYVLPTVSDDGKILSDDDAVENFKKTGKHLGAFDTPENATNFSEKLHNQQADFYGKGLLGDLLNPNRTIPGNTPASSVSGRTMTGAIDPSRIYQDGPKPLVEIPGEENLRPQGRGRSDMIASNSPRTPQGNAAYEPRADMDKERYRNYNARADETGASGSYATAGTRSMIPQDLTSMNSGGAREFIEQQGVNNGGFVAAPQQNVAGATTPEGFFIPPGADVPAGDAAEAKFQGNQQPTSYASGPMPVPSKKSGLAGLFGGGEGTPFTQGVGDVLQALGTSLMSSPRNAPLANFGQTMQALTLASQGRAKSAQEQKALQSLLMKGGFNAQDAATFSVSPQIAKLGLEQIQTQKDAATQAAAGAEMIALRNGVSATAPAQAGVPVPTTVQPAANQAGQPQEAAPQNRETDESAPTGVQKGAAPIAETSPLGASLTGNPEIDKRLKLRQQFVDYIARSTNDSVIKAADKQLQQIDKEISQLGGENGQGKYSLTPVYGTRNGKTVLIQPGSQGKAIETEIPEGVDIANGVEKTDLGTEVIYRDKRTNQIVAREKKDLAGVEREKAVGESQGKAVTGLAQAEATAQNMQKSIEEVKNHPGRDQWGATGASSTWPIIGEGYPNTKGRDFVAQMKQLQGQTFLQAFESLKGAGAITEQEGSKATAAIGRLDRAQTREGLDKALDDLNGIVQRGLERSKARTSVSAESPSGNNPKTNNAPDTPSNALSEAKTAIARGAPRAAVIERLRSMGVDPKDL